MQLSIERIGPDARLVCETQVPRPRSDVFPFFSDCRNLGKLTPRDLSFSILTPEPIVMATGLVIDYRIKLGGLPFQWQSEITAWDPPHRFVDEQRKGPYRKWIHEHRFVDEGNTTRIIDRVDFRSPGGRLAHALFINRKVEEIFRYRTKVLGSLFTSQDGSTGHEKGAPRGTPSSSSSKPTNA